MTALKEYQRLESGGLWRASDDAQRREVSVSFGDATLVIGDSAGRPLSHWSLAAVERRNPGERPALFTPAPDAEEVVEIDDPLMIDAIEKVRKTLARRRPRQGRLRGLGTIALIAAVGLGCYVWLPDALRDQAQRVMPPSKRAEIGAGVLAELQQMTGPICRGARGRAALARFRDRLFGNDSVVQIVVMPLEQSTALPLPGQIIALDRTLVEGLDDPAIVAGYLMAAHRSGILEDPMGAMLRNAGFVTTLRLLATGELAPEVMSDHATGLIGDRAPARLPEAELLPVFDDARISSAAYGRHLQGLGEPVMELIVSDPHSTAADTAVLPDRDWVALQGICDT